MLKRKKRLNVFYLFQEVEESKLHPTSIYNNNLSDSFKVKFNIPESL